METNAPILLFTFKRLDTLKRALDRLRDNELARESDLIVFSDGAARETDKPQVALVRDYLKTIDGFKSVRIVEASGNLGLANSIIGGVSEVINIYGKVIVLEDDILTTPNFLSFMNEALRKYKDSPPVFSVSGYSFNLGGLGSTNADAYFVNRGWSWGWATWKDRWTGVDWSVKDYPSFAVDVKARRKFAEGGSDLNAMLRKQMEGKLDSWAIRWFYHQFRVSGLSLYPLLSKVYNDGFDEAATHTRGSNLRYRPVLDETGRSSFQFPEEIRPDDYFQRRFQEKLGVRERILSRVHTLFDKMIK
jgi:hypothetical protein